MDHGKTRNKVCLFEEYNHIRFWGVGRCNIFVKSAKLTLKGLVVTSDTQLGIFYEFRNDTRLVVANNLSIPYRYIRRVSNGLDY